MQNSKNKPKPKDVTAKPTKSKTKELSKEPTRKNVQPEADAESNPPIRFFYDHIRKQNNAKEQERLEQAALELSKKPLTKKEKRELDATELSNTKRQQRLAKNAQRSRYGAVAPQCKR